MTSKINIHKAHTYPKPNLMDWYTDYCSIVESINTVGDLDLWL